MHAPTAAAGSGPSVPRHFRDGTRVDVLATARSTKSWRYLRPRGSLFNRRGWSTFDRPWRQGRAPLGPASFRSYFADSGGKCPRVCAGVNRRAHCRQLERSSSSQCLMLIAAAPAPRRKRSPVSAAVRKVYKRRSGWSGQMVRSRVVTGDPRCQTFRREPLYRSVRRRSFDKKFDTMRYSRPATASTAESTRETKSCQYSAPRRPPWGIRTLA